MVFTILILVLAALLFSGVLFRHTRMLTYLAVAGLLFEGMWLAITLVSRVFVPSMEVDTVFLVGGILLAGLSIVFVKKWAWPYSTARSGRRDLVILPVLLLVLGAAWLVVNENGFVGHAWVTHGFYNGDTATLLSLTQRSFLTDGLVSENPFAGNGSLEYPTLLHAGLATFLNEAGVGMDWFRFLPLLVYFQIFLTIPIFFLLFDVLFPEPVNTLEHWFGVSSRWIILWLQAGIVLYVIALSWDGHVYPQSHFFLTGLFILLTTLLVQSHRERMKGSFLPLITVLLLTVVLMISNAVTGTAALVLTGVWLIGRAFDKKRLPTERSWQLVAAVALGVLFLWALPGDGAFQLIPHFSYTGALDMLRLALPLGVLGVAIYQYLSRQSFVAVAACALTGLAVVTFFFSSRNIVVENASRFFYHAILVGFPLVLSIVIQVWFWVRRELRFSTHTVPEQVGGWVMSLSLLLLLLFPAGASVASAHDNLMFRDEQTIDTAYRQALWWIEANVEPDAVFITSPEAPFAVPIFTGRSLLRTSYWLSADDAVFQDVIEAFKGNVPAQQSVMHLGDYLLLYGDEQETWRSALVGVPVALDISTVVIYDLR